MSEEVKKIINAFCDASKYGEIVLRIKEGEIVFVEVKETHQIK